MFRSPPPEIVPDRAPVWPLSTWMLESVPVSTTLLVRVTLVVVPTSRVTVLVVLSRLTWPVPSAPSILATVLPLVMLTVPAMVALLSVSNCRVPGPSIFRVVSAAPEKVPSRFSRPAPSLTVMVSEVLADRTMFWVWVCVPAAV